MAELSKVNIEDYISLYEQGLKARPNKPLKNQTYRIFKGKWNRHKNCS